MAQLDSTQFKIQTQTLFPTNGVGGITAADLRTHMDNVADSAVFVAAGKITAPTVNDDDANTAGNGVFQVGHVWIDETGNAAYVCLDNNTGAALWARISSNQPVNAQTGTMYTFALVDNNGLVTFDTASNVTATIQPNSVIAYPVGYTVDIVHLGLGDVSISSTAGVSINGISLGTIPMGPQYSRVQIQQVAPDTWIANGNIGSAPT